MGSTSLIIHEQRGVGAKPRVNTDHTETHVISSQSLWDVYAIDVFQVGFTWDASMKQHTYKTQT